MLILSRPASTDTAPLLFGYAPPRLANDEEKTIRITRRRIERLGRMPVDALILYDVQDESARTDEERPFPYLPTIDPLVYAREYLAAPKVASLPRVIYRAVASHSPAENERHLRAIDPRKEAVVLVGSPSSSAGQLTSLRRAYEIYNAVYADGSGPPLGGVTIPERHAAKRDEDRRLEQKMSHGCSFFVSQCIYDAETARSLLSDYSHAVADRGLAPARIIMTLSPCGSSQTLRFMEWLGISFPHWLKSDLERSGDILERSMDACLRIASELTSFCLERRIPFGFAVESVSIRRAEIDAAEELVGQIADLLDRSGLRENRDGGDR
ncbi:MAG: hypothetical protein ACOC2Q_01065 [Spirochaetota bacterium]